MSLYCRREAGQRRCQAWPWIDSSWQRHLRFPVIQTLLDRAPLMRLPLTLRLENGFDFVTFFENIQQLLQSGATPRVMNLSVRVVLRTLHVGVLTNLVERTSIFLFATRQNIQQQLQTQFQTKDGC